MCQGIPVAKPLIPAARHTFKKPVQDLSSGVHPLLDQTIPETILYRKTTPVA